MCFRETDGKSGGEKQFSIESILSKVDFKTYFQGVIKESMITTYGETRHGQKHGKQTVEETYVMNYWLSKL